MLLLAKHMLKNNHLLSTWTSICKVTNLQTKPPPEQKLTQISSIVMQRYKMLENLQNLTSSELGKVFFNTIRQIQLGKVCLTLNTQSIDGHFIKCFSLKLTLVHKGPRGKEGNTN